MSATLQKLHEWMDAKEDEHLEFKEAKNRYDFEELVKYCVAIANEGGGAMILGVTNNRPRKVVGTQAFEDLERTKSGLFARLRLRIEVEAIQHTDGRVLVFEIPARPIGMPIQYDGRYLMRAGEALVPMTPDMFKRIFNEARPDFSAEVCEKATLADLDPAAIRRFRTAWTRKSRNSALERLSDEQLLADADLVMDGRVTYAALILLGTKKALDNHLAQAEVIFEYRSSEASVSHQQRKEYREGFFLFDDDIWGKINLRNEVQHFRDGMYVWDIPTFNETVIREGILNAVSHRDYRLAGSVFVRQFQQKIEIASPGGFPPGITADNILWKQVPRNRRIAEALVKCGLVERSGQGTDRMFEQCIRESKPRPDFGGTDDHQVVLTLRGDIQDPQFPRFLEQVGKESRAPFTTRDLLVLDSVRCEKPVPQELREYLVLLHEHGVVERIGRGRGTRYVLSRRFYSYLGRQADYTRKRDLDRETNKALLLKHLRDLKRAGMKEFQKVLPELRPGQIRSLVRVLRSEGKIRLLGQKRGSKWELNQ
jgi:ATP-dependent DNA helicase RecG